MAILYDRSDTIRESYNDVEFTMLLTLGLVITVIFLFLRNVSATVIPSLALPFSIIGTFSVMYLLHYSLDNLSMMALILSVGFVVDDAIVMLENIFRHMEMGKKPLVASLVGSKEIGFTIVSMTLSLAAVFIPVLFMGGILGRLFREFSVTICVAILISGVVSVTLTPMLCSRFLQRAGAHGEHGWFYRITEKFFEGMLHAYDVTLKVVLRHRVFTMATVRHRAGRHRVDVHGHPQGLHSGSGHRPVLGDHRSRAGHLVLPDGRVPEAGRRRSCAQNPNVEALMSTVGGTGATTLGGPNFGQLVVRLKPRAQRKERVNADHRRPAAASRPGSRHEGVSAKSADHPHRRAGHQEPVPVLAAIAQQAGAVRERPQNGRPSLQLPGIQDLTSDLAITSPQVEVEIDRDKAAAVQSAPTRWRAPSTTPSGRTGSRRFTPPSTNTKCCWSWSRNIRPIRTRCRCCISNPPGNQLIPLDTLATLKNDVGPQAINHYGQLPAVTLSFDLKPGYALGEVTDKIRDIAAATLPNTIITSFQGAAKAFESSLGNLWLLLIVAILVVYIVLGILYESYIHPLTILSGLPSAGFGALITLYLFHMDLNIYAFVGLIMLIGIVKKNAIMQIDFALDAERNQGMPPDKAIYEGCLIRFRPIMMTTMAALLGAVPIALGYGAGGEARQPLGLVVVGGLMFSQLVTLYLTPVFYTYMARMQDWVTRKRKKPVHEIVPVTT